MNKRATPTRKTLVERHQELRQRIADNIADVAIKSGLADLDLNNRTLRAEFKQIVQKHQEAAQQQ